MRKLSALLLAVLALVQGAARADVWGFIDGQGVAHFAHEQLDERYELFYRAGESFDTAAPAKTRREVPVPAAQSRLLAYFDIAPGFKQVKHHMRAASREHGVEFELLQALIATESGFRPDAVSPKGAIGLMQLMPDTARRYGVDGDRRQALAQKLTDPRTNIRAGTRYLRDLIRRYPGQLELALAAYNAGEGAVQRAGNRIPDYPETRNYVKTVLQLYAMLKPPAGLDAEGRAPGRVRMQLAAPPAMAGGAVNRGNVPTRVPVLSGAAPAPVAASER